MSLTYSIEIKNNISGKTAYVDLDEREDAVLLEGKFTLQQLEQIVAVMLNRDEQSEEDTI